MYTEAELKALKGSLAGLVRQVAEVCCFLSAGVVIVSLTGNYFVHSIILCCQSRGIVITYVDSKSKKVKTKTKPQLIKALAALRHSVAPNRLVSMLHILVLTYKGISIESQANLCDRMPYPTNQWLGSQPRDPSPPRLHD